MKSGQSAEHAAAEHLKSIGYKVIEENWKTKHAEIDIVVQTRSGELVFIEVKYRVSDLHGNGYDYITSNKLKSMIRAAESYTQIQHFKKDYRLGVISMFGPKFEIDFIDLSIFF